MGFFGFFRRADEERFERHERRLNSIDAALKAVGSSTILRLDTIEKEQTRKMEQHAAELSSVRAMICTHKDENHRKLLEIDATVATVGQDLASVKKAVVHSRFTINAMRAYRILVCLAIIVGGAVILSILYGFPQLIPLMVSVFERVVTGTNH